MKKISVGSHGLYALVDDVDFEHLSRFKWNARRDCNTVYAYREVRTSNTDCGRTIQYMHRDIMGFEPRSQYPLVDHRDNNGLNNRRKNLRTASPSQQAMNRRKRRDSNHEYKGVCRKVNHPHTNPIVYWCARIVIEGKRKNVGYCKSELEAAMLYDELARKHYGEYANLNFPGINDTPEA